MHIEYWWESQTERDHLQDQEVGGWIILKWFLKWGGMDWIDLVQHRDHWRAFVNTVMKLLVP
jgi:hypothetical protein